MAARAERSQIRRHAPRSVVRQGLTGARLCRSIRYSDPPAYGRQRREVEQDARRSDGGGTREYGPNPPANEDRDGPHRRTSIWNVQQRARRTQGRAFDLSEFEGGGRAGAGLAALCRDAVPRFCLSSQSEGPAAAWSDGTSRDARISKERLSNFDGGVRDYRSVHPRDRRLSIGAGTGAHAGPGWDEDHSLSRRHRDLPHSRSLDRGV